MRFIIMVGVPGAGKGRWIRQNHPFGFVGSADHFFYALGDGVYQFDPSKLGQAHSSCQSRLFAAMARKEPVVILDNTNLVAKFVKGYVEEAKRLDYDVQVVRITPSSFEAAFERNLHGLPADAHARMVTQFNSRSLPPGVEVVEVTS
jgi:predicted kinase